MIYINNETVEIKLPKHNKIERFLEPFILILRNNITGNNNLYKLENSVTLNEYFYIINSSLSDLVIGEYTYKLTDDNDIIIEEGLLTYGDYTPVEKAVYNTDKNKKIIYERS